MRVLRVLNELKPSGVEVNLRATADEWAKRGITIEILSIGARPGPYAQPLREAGYKIHHIPLSPVGPFLLRFARLLRASDYDLVHVHPERANVYTCSLARIVGMQPVVRSIHNGFTFEGALRLRRKTQRRFLRMLGITYVSVSASVQEIETSYFGNDTLCIYNSYDDDRFSLPSDDERHRARKALGIEPEEFVIASVGNCSAVKNHAAVVQAVAGLPTDIPVRYLHVGLEDADRSEVALARRLRVSDRVEFLGQVEEPSAVLHAADCYVMPSLYEGLGNAALEALGCGLPSVLAEVQGLSDLARFFPTIWWVEPEAGHVQEALKKVANLDKKELARLRTRQATLARQHFPLIRGVDQYETLYRSKLRT